jgi:hypothetical protein
MEKIDYGTGLRFHQHLTTEMAHYAAGYWDLEIKVELRFGSNASDMPTGRADLTVTARPRIRPCLRRKG